MGLGGGGARASAGGGGGAAFGDRAVPLCRPRVQQPPPPFGRKRRLLWGGGKGVTVLGGPRAVAPPSQRGLKAEGMGRIEALSPAAATGAWGLPMCRAPPEVWGRSGNRTSDRSLALPPSNRWTIPSWGPGGGGWGGRWDVRGHQSPNPHGRCSPPNRFWFSLQQIPRPDKGTAVAQAPRSDALPRAHGGCDSGGPGTPTTPSPPLALGACAPKSPHLDPPPLPNTKVGHYRTLRPKLSPKGDKAQNPVEAAQLLPHSGQRGGTRTAKHCPSDTHNQGTELAMKVVRQARLELSGGSTPDLLRPPYRPSPPPSPPPKGGLRPTVRGGGG